MIGYVTIGTKDMAKASAFYDALLGELGAKALMDLGRVTEARRLASAAVDLLVRSGAPDDEIRAARDLLGREVTVGEMAEG